MRSTLKSSCVANRGGVGLAFNHDFGRGRGYHSVGLGLGRRFDFNLVGLRDSRARPRTTSLSVVSANGNFQMPRRVSGLAFFVADCRFIGRACGGRLPTRPQRPACGVTARIRAGSEAATLRRRQAPLQPVRAPLRSQ